MCLSIPVKILEIRNNKAIVEMGGKKRQVDTRLSPKIKKGDYCLINNGFIVKKISTEEAKEIFNIIYPVVG